ncbi:MAG: hypothetical protein Ct9H300mP6_08090 [Gammaproteobacteria bacterium]|nr:MAG: hypothetical protein Ct9H300mP6_08090 [Gammaproteobacteria bacterium]
MAEWSNHRNLFGGWDAEALIYGVNDLGASQSISRKKTFNHLKSLNLDNKGWPKLPPVTVDKENAPCKENIVIDKDVDILKFPWLQQILPMWEIYQCSNIFIEDKELGRNVATYRCQVKAKNKIGFNAEIRQTLGVF